MKGLNTTFLVVRWAEHLLYAVASNVCNLCVEAATTNLQYIVSLALACLDMSLTDEVDVRRNAYQALVSDTIHIHVSSFAVVLLGSCLRSDQVHLGTNVSSVAHQPW